MLDILYKFAQNKYFINKINREKRSFGHQIWGLKASNPN